jgi:hypothetical protein
MLPVRLRRRYMTQYEKLQVRAMGILNLEMV